MHFNLSNQRTRLQGLKRTWLALFIIVSFGLALLMVVLNSSSVSYANNTTYYVNNLAGSNCNNGGAGTSTAAPWCDFTPVNSKAFLPGDQILLVRGATWNMELHLYGSGTSGSWITVDAYGTGNKPKIQRNYLATDRTIYMYDPSYWIVRNLEIANAGDGIRVSYTTLSHEGLRFENLYIRNIDLIVNGVPSTPDGEYYSTGIVIFTNGTPFPSPTQWVSRDIRITNSEIAYTTAPITIIDQTLSSGEESKNSFQNVRLKNLYIHHAKGPMGVKNTTDAKMIDSRLDTLGYVSLPQGTTGIFQWKT